MLARLQTDYIYHEEHVDYLTTLILKCVYSFPLRGCSEQLAS